jgi:hypothetical protein
METEQTQPDGVPADSSSHSPILRYFEYAHLRADLQPIAQLYSTLAWQLEYYDLLGGAEKAVALRKLLESKDAAVRAAL